MNTTIQKWGNSQGLRITKDMLSQLGLKPGARVNVIVQKNAIVIKKAEKNVPSLEELLSRIPKNYKPEEFDWGKPMGKEVW